MKLKIGDKAPDFSLPDKDGNTHLLKDIKSKYIVIYFYPKDNTAGCTIEAKGFEEFRKEFAAIDATIIGIGGGDDKSKARFTQKNNLNFMLLSDPGFKVSSKYGVYGEKKFMGRTYNGISRTTFVLDESKKLLKIWEKVKPATHAEEVLYFIKEMK